MIKMGTNYYAVKKKPRMVKIYDEIHLGKSSAGWKFVFQEQEQYHNFEEFKDFILNNNEWIIKDEYGKEISPKELLKLIEEKQKENNPDDFTWNKNVGGYRFTDRDFG